MPVAEIIGLIAVLARLAEEAIQAGREEIRIEELGDEHRAVLRKAQALLEGSTP